MAAGNGYTPTQKRLLAILSDGMEHTREELLKAISDEMACDNNLNVHVLHLRNRLRVIGQDVILRLGKYRHVRLVSIAE